MDLCISQLVSMFPHMPKEELTREYHASNNDINRTISSILGDTNDNGERKICFSSSDRTTHVL